MNEILLYALNILGVLAAIGFLFAIGRGYAVARVSPKVARYKGVLERTKKRRVRLRAARRAYWRLRREIIWKRSKKVIVASSVAASVSVVGLGVIDHYVKPSFPPAAESRHGRGTGFIIADGYAATNHHVAGSCSKIYVSFKGEDKEVKLISSDEKADIAIVTLPKEIKGPALPIRDWPMAQLGEKFHTIGYPYMSGPGTGIKFHEHMVSGLTGLKNEVMAFQFSNNVYPGNSGSPGFDVNGNVIGVVHSQIDNGANYAARSVTLSIMMKALNIEGAPISKKPWDPEKIEDTLAKSIVAVYCEKKN